MPIKYTVLSWIAQHLQCLDLEAQYVLGKTGLIFCVDAAIQHGWPFGFEQVWKHVRQANRASNKLLFAGPRKRLPEHTFHLLVKFFIDTTSFILLRHQIFLGQRTFLQYFLYHYNVSLKSTVSVAFEALLRLATCHGFELLVRSDILLITLQYSMHLTYHFSIYLVIKNIVID